MATVYVKTVPAFDASISHTISFGYSGNQCIKNRIIIYNSSTAAVVYDNTVTTYSLSHEIPSSTLINGNSYYCTITAYYLVGGVEYNVTSSASNVWKCLTTASWSINGISEGSVIGNSSFTFTMSYSQSQGETVNEYYIVLYNQSGTTYWSSGVLYDVSASTVVTGLPNNSILYARAYGSTIGGLELDTGNVEVTIDYDVPDLYSVAYLENDKWNGWVKVTTNVSYVEGAASGNYTFIDSKYIDLSASSSSVKFEDNFNLSNDFIVESLCRGVSANKSIISMIGTNLSISVTFRSGTFDSGELFFAELKESISGYVLYSNMISIPSGSDFIHVWIQRKSGLYNIVIANMGVG